jgi:murein DD-endopeptidase MepM/ murein hydrolase activator NlpD
MPRFTFPYPIKPWRVTQPWGVDDPLYKRFGFTFHNGVDVAHGEDRLIHAPFTGRIVRTGDQPQGGGIFCGLFSADSFTFLDQMESRVLADFLHCEQLLVTEGQTVFRGQAIAIAGNTGLSTGPHTHIQLRRGSWYEVLGYFVPLDANDANNSFNPEPYYTGTYLIDDELSRISKAIAAIRHAVSRLAKGHPSH